MVKCPMKTFKKVILHLACAGWDLTVAWPIVLAVWFLWGTDLRWDDWTLKARMKSGSFPVSTGFTASGFWKFWKVWPRGFYLYNRSQAMKGETPISWGGTSIGNGQFFGPGSLKSEPTKTMVHEAHHTAQARASAVRATIHALVLSGIILAIGEPWAALGVGLGMWILGGNLSEASGGWISAWLESDPRGSYRGSAHEVGAYAVGDLWKLKEDAKRCQNNSTK